MLALYGIFTLGVAIHDIQSSIIFILLFPAVFAFSVVIDRNTKRKINAYKTYTNKKFNTFWYNLPAILIGGTIAFATLYAALQLKGLVP